jgi:hypothetical protein
LRRRFLVAGGGGGGSVGVSRRRWRRSGIWRRCRRWRIKGYLWSNKIREPGRGWGPVGGAIKGVGEDEGIVESVGGGGAVAAVGGR